MMDEIRAMNLYAKLTNILTYGVGEGPEAQAIRDELEPLWPGNDRMQELFPDVFESSNKLMELCGK